MSMQTARNHVTTAAVNRECAITAEPCATARPLPAAMREITRYVENLLTDEEQRICDMATD